MSRDKTNRKRLEGLVPEVRALAVEHIKRCEEAGIGLLVVFSYRSLEEQAALYAKGRTAPGRVVTNARPGYSWHNYGRAYDVAVAGEDGAVDWDAVEGYRKAGEIGKALGLAWGGDFKAVRGDLGHFEYHPGLTLAQARTSAGLPA